MTAPRLARWRVPLGFVCAGVAFWLARPMPMSVVIGSAIAIVGEAIRLWAAGHLDRAHGITTSGPYALVRHPLYLGSSIITVGFVVASRSWVVGTLAAVYLLLTYIAAIRSEERGLDARFSGGYSAYREGRAPSDGRTFSLARVRANRELRTVAGIVLAFALLAVVAILRA
jgi:protein-S-isoprenylcysteine O-methyltransferase Ste14